ncbi:hypothetical protein F4814DRAFT_431937 [Daldinia grandis]|nr:hypothetical protein F4814DRAFT_431937 [Daldinia grandis]
MNISCIPSALLVDKDIIETLCHSPESSHDQFSAFFRFYCNTLCADLFPTDILANSSTHPLASSIDVTKAVTMLRSQCGTSKETLIRQLFPGLPNYKQEQSLRTLVKISFMLDTASYKSFSDDFQLRFGDAFPVNWKDDQSLVDFIHTTFSPSVYRVTETHNKLKAWKLKKRHGISIVPTNDLIQHLLYDPRSRTLTVFHQVAWLRAQLRHAVEQSGIVTDKEYIERYC